MKKRAGMGLHFGGIGRAALLAAMVGLGAATAGANGFLPVTHHVVGQSMTSTQSNVAGLVSFGGSSGATNVPVHHTGIANVGLGVNSPLLGLSTTTTGVHVPGLLGLSGSSASNSGPTLLNHGTLNLGLGLNLPLLGLPELNVTVHVPTVNHVVGGLLGDVEGVLANPLSLLSTLPSGLLGAVGGLLTGLSGYLSGVPTTLSL